MRNKRRIWLSGFTFCCLLVACAKRPEVDEGEDYIYCLNRDKTGLFKVACEIPKGTAAEAAEEVLKSMAEPSEDIQYMAAIPENVTVDSLKVEHDIAYLDFSESYQELPDIEEKLVRAAVVQSLVRLDGISGVWMTAGQEILKSESGVAFGVMNGDDFVQNTGSGPNAYEQTTLTLFFSNETGDKLVKQQMDVRYNSNVSKEKLIVEKLMGGPKKGGAYPTMNPAAALLSVTIKEGTCYVNFDSEFLNSVYDVRPEITIYSIVNSLLEGTNAGNVQIMVNGEKNVAYQETVDLSQPIARDLTWEESTE
ncbi:MAG: GerMN domain-containing protein [Ruminococcus sp.]|nr:GerMN domain-containing protein [Ruminococcus sp.]